MSISTQFGRIKKIIENDLLILQPLERKTDLGNLMEKGNGDGESVGCIISSTFPKYRDRG